MGVIEWRVFHCVLKILLDERHAADPLCPSSFHANTQREKQIKMRLDRLIRGYRRARSKGKGFRSQFLPTFLLILPISHFFRYASSGRGRACGVQEQQMANTRCTNSAPAAQYEIMAKRMRQQGVPIR
mmetsp:Transcript_39202/g.100443  ORF Transcript_39202/g.100443 Transcript_39202/m.100443 type:complete len:128 (-) Transcript_39202:109-492(-)